MSVVKGPLSQFNEVGAESVLTHGCVHLRGTTGCFRGKNFYTGFLENRFRVKLRAQ